MGRTVLESRLVLELCWGQLGMSQPGKFCAPMSQSSLSLVDRTIGKRYLQTCLRMGRTVLESRLVLEL